MEEVWSCRRAVWETSGKKMRYPSSHQDKSRRKWSRRQIARDPRGGVREKKKNKVCQNYNRSRKGEAVRAEWGESYWERKEQRGTKRAESLKTGGERGETKKNKQRFRNSHTAQGGKRTQTAGGIADHLKGS